MGLTLAVSQQRWIRVAMYGHAGSGKTFTALLFGEGLAKLEKSEIGMIDTEHGSDFYTKNVPTRKIHPKAFRFFASYDKSLSGVIKVIEEWDDKKFKMCVVDSMTHIWEAAIDSYPGERDQHGNLPISAWKYIKGKYKKVMTGLENLNAHVIILGREGAEYGEDEKTGKDGVIGKKMKAEAETQYEMHMTIRMESQGSKRRAKEPKVFAYMQRDRMGVLQGQTIPMPTYAKVIKPLIHLLDADEQAHIQTAEEISAEDADNFATEDHEKQADSEAAMLVLRKAINEADNMKNLKEIGKTIKDEMTNMIPIHITSLRNQYLDTLDRMKQSAAPGVERQKLEAKINAYINNLPMEDVPTFFKICLDGRCPEWPAKFTMVDLRLCGKAIDGALNEPVQESLPN